MQAIETLRHETARVAHHIAGAERVVARSKARPTRVKRLIRALLLEELAAYRERGTFPLNRDFSDRPMPYFIDAGGTRCAMAHLMELGGAAALVARLAAERNNAFVSELGGEPEVLAWLDAAGLDVAEAARIQPSYSCADNASAICGFDSTTAVAGGVGPEAQPTGVLEVVITEITATGALNARIEAYYGDVGGLRVGTEISTYVPDAPVGTTVLVPVSATSTAARVRAAADYEAQADMDGGRADAGPSVLELGAVGIAVTGDAVTVNGHSITKAQAIDATRSSGCRGKLEAIDPYWTENVEGCSAGEGGCSTTTAAPEPSAASIQILIALVSAGIGRRLLRRR